jgi:hypothetical protein
MRNVPYVVHAAIVEPKPQPVLKMEVKGARWVGNAISVMRIGLPCMLAWLTRGQL